MNPDQPGNPGQRPHPVWRTLAFLLLVGAVCALIMTFPPHWKRGGEDWYPFPRWSDLGGGEAGMAPDDVANLLDAYGGDGADSTALAGDSAALPDWLTDGGASPISGRLNGKGWPEGLRWDREAGLRAAEDSTFLPNGLHRNLRLSGDSLAWKDLWAFFEQMARLEPGDRAVHVLHYGDSQIEGDRITGELRRAWQAKWGGSGPGLVSGVVQVQHLAFNQQTSDHWQRATSFMQRKPGAALTDFGLLGTRADPVDSAVLADLPDWARMTFAPRNTGYKGNRTWPEMHLWTGPVAQETPFRVRSQRDTSWVLEGALPADSDGHRWAIQLKDRPDPTADVVLEIASPPPAIHAVGFWSRSGIVVHNIPMRGASGTQFRKMSEGIWGDQIRSLPVGLIVLQFGGNAVPSISDAAAARRYAVGFGAQIALFRSMFPGVPVLVIGPSDMAIKVGEQFETYPMLVAVRDQLKQVAREQHALYWDLFEVMGGPRSMHAWVTSEPPLAGPDHIHFSPLGARRVGELLVQSMEAEWGLWASAVQRRLNLKTPARP